MGGREEGIRTCMVVFAYPNHTVHWHVCLTMLLIHAALQCTHVGIRGQIISAQQVKVHTILCRLQSLHTDTADDVMQPRPPVVRIE